METAAAECGGYWGGEGRVAGWLRPRNHGAAEMRGRRGREAQLVSYLQRWAYAHVPTVPRHCTPCRHGRSQTIPPFPHPTHTYTHPYFAPPEPIANPAIYVYNIFI